MLFRSERRRRARIEERRAREEKGGRYGTRPSYGNRDGGERRYPPREPRNYAEAPKKVVEEVKAPAEVKPAE